MCDIPTGNFDPVFCSYPAADPHQGRCRGKGNILKEAVFGFRYIFARPSLLGLQLVFFFGNLCSGMCHRRRSDDPASDRNDSVSLGLVQSAGAIGGVVGRIAMSAWGGFKRKVHGVLGAGSSAVSSLL